MTNLRGCFAQDDGVGRVAVPNPFAKCAKGWGTRFRANLGELQVLPLRASRLIGMTNLSGYFAQDDGVDGVVVPTLSQSA